MKHQSDAVFVGGGEVVIGEAAHVFDMEDFENVVDTGDDLNVGFLRVHHVAALGERHQHAIALIFLEEGVVFRCEVVATPIQLQFKSNSAPIGNWKSIGFAI